MYGLFAYFGNIYLSYDDHNLEHDSGVGNSIIFYIAG